MTTAMIYEHADFDGHSLLLAGSDSDLTDNVMDDSWLFGSTSWNDEISSLKVFDGPITVYEHINYQGASHTYYPGDTAYVGDLWNDQISSIWFGDPSNPLCTFCNDQ